MLPPSGPIPTILGSYKTSFQLNTKVHSPIAFVGTPPGTRLERTSPPDKALLDSTTPDVIAPAEMVDSKCSAEYVGNEDMQDCLSAEARDDVEEESPRVFAIAVGLKEIEWARVLVEKGEVKENEFERI